MHEGSLVMMYNSKLDSTFQTKLQSKWLDPFRVVCTYANGSYQLEDKEGKLLKHKVNGFCLKLYFVRDLIPSVHAFVESKRALGALQRRPPT